MGDKGTEGAVGAARQTATGRQNAIADRGSTAIVAVYENATLHPVDPATILQAKQLLSTLPVDSIPGISPLPAGSRMPLSHNPLFVGRTTALRTLASLLKDSEAANGSLVPTVAVTGLGGMGKTQVACEFVYRYGHYFAGGVFWLSFANEQVIPSEIAVCHTALGQELPLDIASLPLNEQLLLVLGAWQNELPRLLIFDNCEEDSILARWRPPTGGCRVLLTSRRAHWAPELGVQTLSLEGLQRQESITLLRQYRPDLLSTEGDAIADELGDLPLAIHLTGSFLHRYRNTQTGTAATYLSQLRQYAPLQHISLQGKGTTFSATNHEQNIERTFALSYDRLDTSDATDAEAIHILTRAACFAPGQPIPRFLLFACVQQKEVTLEDEMTFEDALERLTSLGLLENLEDRMLRLHRLLVAFTRMHLGKTGQEARDAVERALLNTTNQLNEENDLVSLLPLQPHLYAVTDAAKLRLDEQAAALCKALGTYLMKLGNYRQAYPYLQRALDIRENILGPEHPDTALSLHDLADLYFDQRDYEHAYSYLDRTIAIQRKALNAEHPDLAWSLHDLGVLYTTSGKYEQAESFFQQALSIYEKIYGPEHPKTAWILDDLAGSYTSQGLFDQARPLYDKVLAIRQKSLGPEHPDMAWILNDLANLYAYQKQYDQARPLYEQALTIRQKVLGPEHPDTATVLYNLAYFYADQGLYDEARPLYEQALAIRQKVLGPEHPDTAAVLNDLATLYANQAQYDQARPLYEQALAIRQKSLGPEHLDTAMTLNDLANLYFNQAQYDEARSFYEQALAIFKKVLGPEHPSTAIVLNNLAGLNDSQKQQEQSQTSS